MSARLGATIYEFAEALLTPVEEPTLEMNMPFLGCLKSIVSKYVTDYGVNQQPGNRGTVKSIHGK